MDELQKLREKRGELIGEIDNSRKLMLQEEREWTPQDEERWVEVQKDYDELNARIERIERAEEIVRSREETNEHLLDAAGGSPVGSAGRLQTARNIERSVRTQEEQRALAFQAWAAFDLEEPSDDHMEACRALGVNPRQKEFEITLRRDVRQVRREVRAAQSTTLDAEQIPEGFVNNLERAMQEHGGVREVADVMRTATGARLPWPTLNDVGNAAVQIGENQEMSEVAYNGGFIEFGAYKFYSMLLLSYEIMRDSAFNLAQEASTTLGERMARGQNAVFTNGDGTTTAHGIVTAAAAGLTTALATAIAAEELIQMVHSVDPAYRNGARWMTHDNTILAIRRLKDGDGQFLWQPGLQAGAPDRLLGYPITVNQDMADTISTGNDLMLFGRLNKYKIRDVASLRLRRLDERYAEFDQTAFMILHDIDGELLDAGTNPVKKLTAA